MSQPYIKPPLNKWNVLCNLPFMALFEVSGQKLPSQNEVYPYAFEIAYQYFSLNHISRKKTILQQCLLKKLNHWSVKIGPRILAKSFF